MEKIPYRWKQKTYSWGQQHAYATKKTVKERPTEDKGIKE